MARPSLGQAERVVAAVIRGLRTPGIRPSRSSNAWVAPDLALRVWRPYRGEAGLLGAVLVGEEIEGGDNPLSPAASFCKLMGVDDLFLKAMCDAYDGRVLYEDLLSDESYREGAAAGLALRDIIFPG